MLDQFPLSARLPASDIARARAWYHDHLGLDPAKEGLMGNLWYETGGTWFLLYQTPSAGTARNTAAGWQVRDIESVMTTLRDRGVAFEEYDFGPDFRTVNGLIATPEGKAALFRDSEGNIIEISEPDDGG